MNRRKRFLALALSFSILLAGCVRDQIRGDNDYVIYYLNADNTGLVEEYCEVKGESIGAMIEEVLSLLQKEPDTIDYKSIFADGVEIIEWKLDETKLDLYFNESYAGMNKKLEILVRAAVVQSLVQIPGIDYVQLLVDGEPLTRKNGTVIGYMRAEDFVQNTGSSLHFSQFADLTLYFANEAGDWLVTKKRNVRYSSNMSVEKLTVEQLMKGPGTGDGKSTIPAQAKVLGVSVKDHVCYVNFDEGFLNIVEQVNPRLTIYSLVNSIIDSSGSGTTQVQILVNGESNVVYQETIDLSKPFSRDPNLIRLEESREE